jgi:hypothetical protein
MLVAEPVEAGGNQFGGGIPGACSQAAQRSIHLIGACFHGGERIADAHAEIIVAMKTDLRFERFFQYAHAFSCASGQQRAGGIHDVNAIAAIALHEQRLFRENFSRTHVGHHQEADGFQTHLLRHAEVLLGNVGLGALRGDAHHLNTTRHRLFQFFFRADPRDQKCGDFRIGNRVARLFNEVHFIGFGEAVLNG